MSLMLSRHGIWYYRKVNVLPCSKRREFRRSLGTRSKTEATKRSLRFADRPWLITETISPTIGMSQTPQSELSFQELKLQAVQYVEFKNLEVCEREAASIKRCIDKYFSFTDQVFKRSRAAEFISGLDVAIPTKNKYVKKISGFFRWLKHRTDYDFQNPFEGLLQKDREPVSQKREAYTSAQIRCLENGISALPDWKRWIILLGRFTGMRANEICQLYHGDILKNEGRWCIRIDDRHGGQVVKTENSKRTIPIHQKLIDIGFLVYVQKQKGRLFPQLTFYKGSYSHYFTRWFSGYRKKLGVPEFHSLRHYIATKLKNAGVVEHYAAAFLGHADNSITYRRYGKSVAVSQLYDLLEHI
ncbi:site-specific integrase [Escherichia coli]|uniref:site-specific integrase n=2 Tax=Escherichia coli TaxID=562 RepID=UPI0002242EAE|nr:site-specific integrase [Escherichia coli]EFG2121708.1 site-specific integrase [Escherichia coli]EGR9533121.1 site-specific integrase [Escherichia coli]EGW98073.1 phage integrase family protein [Escherichia coli STEC_EH250]EIG5750016.1 site-specific integrase [Escherichia coli]EIH9513563.1 site-specific integrase [Escherichia coli]